MYKRKIIELLADVTDTALDTLLTLPGDTPLMSFGLDSLSFIRFIVALEEAFDFEVLDSDLILSNFQTLDMLFATLRKYLDTSSALKKVLVCDCDNCLWHGIAGEEEIFTDNSTALLHQELIRLKDSGVLLCICSKNDMGNILHAFAQLSALNEAAKLLQPEHFLLRPEHFLLMKVNRNPKTDNLLALSKELNLSIDSFVFLDDSDYELGLVNAIFPQVRTVKADYSRRLPSGEPAFLEELHSYFASDIPGSDRTRLYREQKEREKYRQRADSVAAYNASLHTTVTCEKAAPEQADRIAELSQRTNQCNLACTRYTRDDIVTLLNCKDYTLLTLQAGDIFGDMGIVGAAVIRHNPSPVIEAFFLSCRAFDRGFEEILLNQAKTLFSSLQGIYIESEKNKRYATFYSDHGVTQYEGL